MPSSVVIKLELDPRQQFVTIRRFIYHRQFLGRDLYRQTDSP